MISASLFGQKKNGIPSTNLESIVLGGGCYWCVEAVYENLNGVNLLFQDFLEVKQTIQVIMRCLLEKQAMPR